MRFHSSRRKSRRTYTSPLKRKQALFLLLLFLCSAVFSYGAIRLIAYVRADRAAKATSDIIRQIYYAATPTQQPDDIPTPAPAAAATALPVLTPAATANAHLLSQQAYPGNPYAIITGRFQDLQKKNRDIIGWLKAADIIDEAVVYKDNTTYLDKDYLKQSNPNGAIFLDENCDLTSRPYTYLLYGHNMKTGAMFGSLRNYENLLFLLQHPFITFDTGYETGRYVVFAAGTVSTDHNSWQYLDFTKLCSALKTFRDESIDRLKMTSVFDCPLDVKAEDQLLLLVTCSEDDDQRRIVAARRIRNNESEQTLLSIIQHTHIK